MRDEQVRRYARHILLPDVGGLGQTALLVATAIVDLRSRDPAATIAARYLAAGGVGTIVLLGASDSDVAALAAHGPDTQLIVPHAPTDIPERARPVDVPGKPRWWDDDGSDALALAFWRGGLAATAWMAAVANG